MSKKTWNFSAGPAMLPHEVMLQVQEEFLNWQERGVSVIEVSHRSQAFMDFAAESLQDLRDLLSIPSDYEIIYSTGGAAAHFALLPMNLLQSNETAAYAITGLWSKKAVQEAKRYVHVDVVTDSYENKLLTIDPTSVWQISKEAQYLHYASNETVDGLQFHQVPDVSIPLIADMSSDILSKPIDVNKFAVIYASAQKNIAPAGLTILIMHRDWVRSVRSEVPSVFNYINQQRMDSMANTPPTFSWYMAGLVYKWLKAQGGLAQVEKSNQQKAQLLYDVIDRSSLYVNHIAPCYRSRMNMVFDFADEALLSKFLIEADAYGLMGLKGHKLRGGIRASIYNAMPLEGVQVLIDFMKEFEKHA